MFCLNNELIGYGCAGWCWCLVLFIVRSYYCKLFDVVCLFGSCLFGWLFAVGCDFVLFWLLIVLFVDCGFWCCCWDSCCCRCCVCLCVLCVRCFVIVLIIVLVINATFWFVLWFDCLFVLLFSVTLVWYCGFGFASFELLLCCLCLFVDWFCFTFGEFGYDYGYLIGLGVVWLSCCLFSWFVYYGLSWFVWLTNMLIRFFDVLRGVVFDVLV